MNNRKAVSPANKKAVLSFFFAILALVLSFLPLMSFLFIAISVALGLLAKRQGNKGGAVAGLAISALAFIVALIFWISSGSLVCGTGGGHEANNDYTDFDDDYISESDASGSDLSGSDSSLADDVDFELPEE